METTKLERNLYKICRLLKNRKPINETTQNKSKSINNENNAFQSELFLLQQEYQKRCKEVSLWFGTEKRKIMIRHNQKLQNIQIL